MSEIRTIKYAIQEMIEKSSPNSPVTMGMLLMVINEAEKLRVKELGTCESRRRR